MKLLMTLVFLPLIACAAADQRSDRQIIADEIERMVKLPDGARPLKAYGRNYAFDGQGKVVANYLMPLTSPSADEGCEVMENFDSRPCTPQEIKELMKADASMAASQTPAGEIRWHESVKSLPYMNDGGCSQVNVEYDIAAHRVLTVECNGDA